MDARTLKAAITAGGLALATAAATLPSVADTANSTTARLSSEIEAILREYPWRGARWSVMVVSLDRGDTLLALAPDSAMAPASNLKLLTSAAALREFGPDYRYRTWLLTEGVVAEGTLQGDLVLYGTGDPGISDRFYPTKEAVFQELADELLARGITRVTGDLVGDASFFPGPLRPSGWDPEDLNDHFAAAVSALSFNENVVSVRIEPAERAGLPPAVHTLPDHAGLTVDNQAVTTEGRGSLLIGRDDPLAPVVIQGAIQRGGRPAWREITVSVPAAFGISVFRFVLESRGVQVLGRDRVVSLPRESSVGGPRVTAPALQRAPRTRILATHVSPPLRDYLAVVNKKSNNLFTELVFRGLGRDRFGTGSPEASARAVAASLAPLGVDTARLAQLDGSGLSAGNRVRVATFVDVFSRMASSDEWGEFWATLPEAGNRRELARMYRTPAAGNLRAKTGTIQGVSALSGVVQSRDGERLAFSIIVNGTPSTTRAKRVENEIGVRLASFSRGPEAAAQGFVGRLPPPPLPTDSGGPARHRVGQGESLDEIARRYGLTLEELRRANSTVEPRRLQVGSWLILPSGGSGGGAAAHEPPDFLP
ncbi:MAG: D-alanyl-D-alanine carboxypeptidase/D-alanyl-D-alanine-endopeptidase [Longimicrobiales bacterium]|nr:D-alanyl-D-alanine carboxypeptidase/D-alanyl-D-alanine-endopeptidase [Longimicrobiales bacterium]